MKFIFFLLVLFTPFSINADWPRHKYSFTSLNGKFELRYVSRNIGGEFYREKWELIEKATSNSKYELIGDNLSSMTILVNDEGKNVVAIDDDSERNPSETLDVLLFYVGGKLIKKYSLGELLNDTENIESSVSHFRWFFSPHKLRLDGSKLSLSTFELVDYTFDTNTGEIYKKERDSVLTDDALYIYGTVEKLGDGHYEMKVCHVIQGEIPKEGKVRFEVPKTTKFYLSLAHTVIIRNGKLITQKGVMLNSCNYHRKQRQSNKSALIY